MGVVINSVSNVTSPAIPLEGRTGPSRGEYAGPVIPERNVANYSKRPPYPEALIDRMSRIIREKMGDNPSILDVACGNGRGTNLIRKMCSRHVQGIDIDPKMIEQAKAHSKSQEFNDILYHEGRVEELSKHFPKERFPVITVCTALHYFDSPEGLGEIKSILTPNGIVIEVRGGGPLRERNLQEALGIQLEGESGGRRGRGQTRQNMEKAGFAVTHSEEFLTEQVYDKEAALADINSGTSSRSKSREGLAKKMEQYFESNRELKVSRTYKLAIYRQK
jgi:SAM-dependent methyltransferase